MTSNITTAFDDDHINPNIEVDAQTGLVEVGQWYWVTDEPDDEWLACVTHIGSNFVEVTSPKSSRGYHQTRVHFNDFTKSLRFEPNAKVVIDERIHHYQALTNKSLEEVKAITARLGVSNNLAIESSSDKQNTALVTMSSQPDVNGYKNALIKAKKEELPALFEKIKRSSEEIARWMSAESLPLEAYVKQMEGSIGEIDGRIFNVSLYAGLTENVQKCCDGEPAAFHEKLRVMQRRLYMDEECLVNYRVGGMSFSEIGQFDQWICEPENRDRLLPFPRCAVAMRVRRNEKEREADGLLSTAYINVRLAQADKLTYIYIRNGEQVYRMDCDLEFSEMIFPDKSMFDASEPMMVKMFCSRIDRMMSVNEYESRVKEKQEREIKEDQWALENPEETWDKAKGYYGFANPYRSHDSFRPSEWQPFDQNNVFFDECMKEIEDKIAKYNRIAIIIQGLFDRSEVLHPHPPVKTWDPLSFSTSVELVFDANMVLSDGEAPDFEVYRAKCNALTNKDSVMVGQEMFWMVKEAEKESRRLDNDWRNRSDYRPKTFTPYGNPGPGYVAKMDNWKPKSQQAVFSWNRQRLSESRFSYARYGDDIRTTITVPLSALFNASAYQAGDFKQFFKDPRTRAQYLKWAPMLLAAEEYCAGNVKPEEPVAGND